MNELLLGVDEGTQRLPTLGFHEEAPKIIVRTHDLLEVLMLESGLKKVEFELDGIVSEHTRYV